MRVIKKILDFFHDGPRKQTIQNFNSIIFHRARSEAMRLNHEHVGVEHLFLAVVGASKPERLGELRERVPSGPDWVTIRLEPTLMVRVVMRDAAHYARAACRDEIQPDDLWQALKNVGTEDVDSWARRLQLDISSDSPADA